MVWWCVACREATEWIPWVMVVVRRGDCDEDGGSEEEKEEETWTSRQQ